MARRAADEAATGSTRHAKRISSLLFALGAISGLVGMGGALAGQPSTTVPAAKAALAPRLYIHYREPAQAVGVAALRKALATTELAGRRLQVLVPKSEPSSTKSPFV